MIFICGHSQISRLHLCVNLDYPALVWHFKNSILKLNWRTINSKQLYLINIFFWNYYLWNIDDFMIFIFGDRKFLDCTFRSTWVNLHYYGISQHILSKLNWTTINSKQIYMMNIFSKTNIYWNIDGFMIFICWNRTNSRLHLWVNLH